MNVVQQNDGIAVRTFVRTATSHGSVNFFFFFEHTWISDHYGKFSYLYRQQAICDIKIGKQ